MPRSIDPYLKSTLSRNSGTRYAKCFIRFSANSTDTSVSMDVLEYKLSATELWLKAKFTLAADAADKYFVCLRRGVLGDGDPTDGHNDHYLDSGNFEIASSHIFMVKNSVYTGAVIEITADLFARRKVVLAADVSYQTLITNYCTAVGKVAFFKLPASDFWSYKFEKAGVVLTVESGKQFLSLIKAKYSIYAVDKGGTDDVLFYAAFDPPSSTNDDYSKTIEAPIETEIFPNPYTKYITIMYEDETGALIDYTPDGSYTYLDQAYRMFIGYLESTDKPPTIYRDVLTQLRLVNLKSTNIVQVNVFPDLEMQQGDVVYLTGKNSISTYIYLDHVEYLDRKKKPAWGYLLRSLDRIQNTVSGNLPESVWLHGANIPLDVSSFDGVLSDKDTTIQRAFQTLDDAVGGPPALHAATHEDGGPDEIGTINPTAFRIPKANALGILDGWVRDATEAIKGKVELATSAETAAGLAVQASDTRLSDARTPTSHASTHESGGSDEISISGSTDVLKVQVFS